MRIRAVAVTSRNPRRDRSRLPASEALREVQPEHRASGPFFHEPCSQAAKPATPCERLGNIGHWDDPRARHIGFDVHERWRLSGSVHLALLSTLTSLRIGVGIKDARTLGGRAGAGPCKDFSRRYAFALDQASLPHGLHVSRPRPPRAELELGFCRPVPTSFAVDHLTEEFPRVIIPRAHEHQLVRAGSHDSCANP